MGSCLCNDKRKRPADSQESPPLVVVLPGLASKNASLFPSQLPPLPPICSHPATTASLLNLSWTHSHVPRFLLRSSPTPPAPPGTAANSYSHGETLLAQHSFQIRRIPQVYLHQIRTSGNIKTQTNAQRNQHQLPKDPNKDLWRASLSQWQDKTTYRSIFWIILYISPVPREMSVNPP